MSDVLEGLATFLASDPTVRALVVTGSEERIFPLVLPQPEKLPALVYQLVGNVPEQDMDGVVNLESARVQVDAHARTHPAAKQLGRAVRKAVEAYVGRMGDVRVHQVRVEGERDWYDDVPRAFVRSVDLLIWHDRE